MKTLILRIAAIILTVILSATVLIAAEYTAEGGQTSDWDNASSWNTGDIPDGTNDNITIRGSATIIIPSYFSADLGDLTLAGSGNLIIEGNVTFNSITIESTSSSITINGQVIITNSLTNANTIENNGNLLMEPGSYIENNGDITGAGDICNTTNTTPPNFTVMGTITNTICGTDADNAFPVELTGFNVNQSGNSVNLHWVTASELNNDFFTVERAVNNNEFQSIGEINGAGTSNEIINYHFKDNDIPEAETVYYRIKQTDYNGETSYSGIQDVKFAKPLEISIYPNPARQGDNLTLNSSEKNAIFKIYDAHGTEIYSGKINQNTENIQTTELKPGIYFIRTNNQNSNNPVTKKLIIQ
ncbi:MAG: T9SS type A sorting domain-containing protein [Bacteroidales bacterium]|nr:T9SS type A sorting domain-containing protein [Bacteroidales bacterium]